MNLLALADRAWGRAAAAPPRRSASACAARLFLLVVLAGCTRAATDDQPAAKPAPESVSLRLAGAEGLEKTLAAHRGKVVLVDFWATWCAPCVAQFPHTIELHRKYHDRGLVVVGVSMNEPVELPEVRRFLTEQQAPFENLLSKYESGVQAIEEFALPGPVPCYRVYDRQGVLRSEFVVDPRAARQYTSADIEAAIVKLLSDQPR